MLHILDGESTAGTLKQTDVPGEKFPFRDALIEGPAPIGVEGLEWRRMRAQHLSDYYGLDEAKAANELELQEQALVKDHDEVILWFEHDLFCQVNLLYLLNWFTQHEPNGTKVSLISIDRFPGIEDFRGLGQLNPQQLAPLFGTRHQLTPQEWELGTKAWQAYCSPEPTRIVEVLRTDLSALPFLKRAFELHLRRFPSVHNGLGNIEQAGLDLIADGSARFGDLFPRFGAAHPVYGLGDCQFWLALKRMGDAKEPLLRISDGSHGELTSQSLLDKTFELTSAGRDVREGKADFVTLNGIDLWLGGVHLREGNVWRWDETKQAVKRE